MRPSFLSTAPVQEHAAGFLPAPAWVAPFVAMLLAIAVLPLVAPRWWHSNLNRFKVSLLCGLPVLGLFAWHGEWEVIRHTVHEYASFVLLLTSLYVASGGIVLRGDLKATPWVNAAFLLLGALLASFMGTTGAAMLLIRPLLKTISERRYRTHTVVFFIFMVCNIGGCLTPLGDPPLFLGYLRGVPFSWTFGLVKEWAFVNFILLGVYLALDSWFWRHEDRSHLLRDRVEVQPLRLAGGRNFLWLGAVVLSVAFLTPAHLAAWLGGGEHGFWAVYGRDLALVAIAFLAYRTTPAEHRRANAFTWHPMVEVGALFFGIFLSMMAAIQLLHHYGPELGVEDSHMFFWATGSLSSFLDNAPTYVVFFETAASLGVPPGHPALELATGRVVSEYFLIAVSLGAVFMGAMTYIGNAPNFMVKAIAEERKVPMPSFFGYLLYSVVFLLPVFFLTNLIFLR
ncbi:MAG: sodium:proton antiporter [Planctomycetota bacterium]|nr:MAG: sodium:proton antiporter [Planctomycetota bacterium]